MERHDGDLVQWIETFELTPGARETWTCCLEPGEVVAVNLSATGPVDVVLMDLDSYEVQEERDDMPFSPRFANDTRSVDWNVQPTSPGLHHGFGRLQPRRRLRSGRGDSQGSAASATSDRVRWLRRRGDRQAGNARQTSTATLKGGAQMSLLPLA
jgi:hypothetical protein